MAEETDPIERFYARYKADQELERSQNGHTPWLFEWEAYWDADTGDEWLVDGLWPLGRHLHIFASAKSGKSLVMLWMAMNITLGREPFTGEPMTPRVVVYFDYEMTPSDVVERVQDMGFTLEQAKMLKYSLYPDLPPLDTNDGGKVCLERLQSVNAEVVIFDTLSRVVKGEENSNDTYRNFHLYTGVRLKAAGISMCRLDHEGKVLGSSRGASAKVDDVDLVYQLQPVDGGIKLKRMVARISSTRDEMTITKVDEPLGFITSGERLWPAGTVERAKMMDDLDMPLDVSKRQAIAMFREKGLPQGKGTVLLAAINYRKWRMPLL